MMPGMRWFIARRGLKSRGYYSCRMEAGVEDEDAGAGRIVPGMPYLRAALWGKRPGMGVHACA